jgi:hypothetical protein
MTRLTTTTPLAVSADYHDALLTARRAKNTAFLLLLLFLLLQVTLFFLVRYDVIKLGGAEAGATATVETPATGPSKANLRVDDLASYATGVIVFAAPALAILMAVVLLLTSLTMLQGRLIGVAHVVSAFTWAVVLIVLLLPWQRFYAGGPTSHASQTVSSQDDFRLPGVLYTWPELAETAHFSHENMGVAVLKYTRFVAAPLVALLILFMVQAKSGRGVKYALGEAEVHVDVATTDV